jgi:hypothetical protein
VEEHKRRGPAGAASFCIPKAAVRALLDARADAVTIGAYLTLACFTDATGVYSTAALRAVRDYQSLHQDRGKRALEALQSITVGKGKTAIALAYSRDAWLKKAGGEALPDGLAPRAQVNFILPDFAEPAADRVWFSSALVQGFGTFTKPLKRLKDAGDVAARLFLLMQQTVDMVRFGGVPPSTGPWQHYESADGHDLTVSNSRLLIAKSSGHVASQAVVQSTTGGTGQEQWKIFWNALSAIVGSGLFYEVVLVLNRNPVPCKFTSGESYGDVPEDADPVYELDARSLHGFKPEGEMGLAGLTARTAGELGHSVVQGTLHDSYGNPMEVDGYYPGQFDGRYAAIVPRGYGAMIVGCFRPRFRISNPKNAGVKDAWTRIYDGNRQGFEWITALRMARGLAAIPKPAWLEPKVTQRSEPTPEPTSSALGTTQAQWDAGWTDGDGKQKQDIPPAESDRTLQSSPMGSISSMDLNQGKL